MGTYYYTLTGLSLLLLNYKTQAMTITFKDKSEISSWIIVNDGVMGGLSESRASIDSGELLFTGNLSLRNNGGFASIRRLETYPSRSSNRVKIRVNGDGRTYQLRLRQTGRWGGIAYMTTFVTQEGQWLEKSFSIDDFRATFRGRAVLDAPRLSFDQVKQLGFMIADKTEGRFSLKIESIAFAP